MSLLIACVVLGCPSPDTGAPSTARRVAEIDPAYPYERDTVQIRSGHNGRHQLSHGKVLTAEGGPCPNAIVTLAQTFEGSTRHYLVVRSNDEGDFEIRGDVRASGSDMIWAATEGRRLGRAWNTHGLVTIRLLGGSTVLHVTTEECTPVPNATVTVYQSSIDTISMLIPPNIRRILTTATDENGVATFPSQLGDTDLGFRARAPGYPTTTRAGYGSGSKRINLLVLSDSSDAMTRCREVLTRRLFPGVEDPPRVNIGYAAR
jgi:hypothetical protein